MFSSNQMTVQMKMQKTNNELEQFLKSIPGSSLIKAGISRALEAMFVNKGERDGGIEKQKCISKRNSIVIKLDETKRE